MSSVNGILFIEQNGVTMGLDILLGLDKKTHRLFMFLISRSKGGIYLAGLHKDRACANLGISEATYWRKLKKLVGASLLENTTRGVYEINDKLLRVVKDADIAMEKVKAEIRKRK